MLYIKNKIDTIKSFLAIKTSDAEHQFINFGLLTSIGFPIFYLINIITKEHIYDNIFLRIFAISLSIPLIFHKKFFKNKPSLKPYYWYFSITFILPFFFTFMLLKNSNNLEWNLNSLIIICLLILILDWISVLFVSITGIFSASFLYYILDKKPQLPQDIKSLVITICSLLIYCVLFSHKKEAINNERKLRLIITEELNLQLEQKVAIRTQELENALEAKTEFLNNMSHEIRTPIQGFTNISEGLVDHWADFNDSKKLDLASQIASNAKRLKNLIGNLLDLSKFSAGKMLLNLTQTDLNKLILDMIEECRQLYLTDKSLEITFNKTENAQIMADEMRISQVLRNLFTNAIKFSPNNSKIDVKITRSNNEFHNDTEKDFLIFSIKDQGVGIPEEELKTIFYSFTQSSKTKTKAGGTGLGLTIAKEIIEAHGGIIWTENNTSQGSTFFFTLPITEKTQKDKTKLEEDSKTKSATIMIIDDEDACLTSMEMVLYKTNYHLIKMNNGNEALT
jgi:signal transduction histidine kinase